VSRTQASPDDPRAQLLALYDSALPYVYGYLLARCGHSQAVAEELTSETLLAAVSAVRGDRVVAVTTPWLIGIARHKLVDHWRRVGREQRGLHTLAADGPTTDDPWDAHVDRLRAQAILDSLAPQHRLALTLRYVDDLPVSEVAELLDRTLHATEALLVRARAAFRRAYQDQGPAGEEESAHA
jgi:RNA polymerase sigma-70 factor (ECF subfamily)